jgi:molybdopterin-guanine dinucleotide biosynthesis protein A
MISVAILAGGKSTRMGRDKAFLEVGGKMVVERVIERVQPLTDDLFVNTNTPTHYEQFRLRMEKDVYPGKAALGGIFTAIHAARHPHVLVVACDMPFLNSGLLKYLADMAPIADVVIPLVSPPQPETLHAVYSKACLPVIEPRLRANRLRIIGFFDDVSVHYIERQEVTRFDPQFRSFINLNTPDDLDKARHLAGIV